MCYTKSPSAFRLGESVVGISNSSPPPPPSSHDDVLQDLFRARFDCPSLPVARLCTNQRPRRSTPLTSIASGSLSLYESKTSEWNHTSLLHSLGQQKSLKPLGSENSTRASFPLHSAFFTTTSSIAHPTPNAACPSITGDADLDQRIRSFSTSLRTNAAGRKRPRNQATRYRLVGQAMGQKGVAKVVATVKELKRVQAEAKTAVNATAASVKNLLNDTVLTDAWENTPTDDLKSLPWEEMLQTSLKHLEAYKSWKADNH